MYKIIALLSLLMALANLINGVAVFTDANQSLRFYTISNSIFLLFAGPFFITFSIWIWKRKSDNP